MPTSPNWNERPGGAGAIDCLLLHYTGMCSGEAAIARLCDPAAEVSAHYVVLEDGRIVQLVADDKRAWHAGVSSWRGREGLNDVAIGIEIVNPGHAHGLRPFPERQMRAVAELGGELVARYGIDPVWILGHSDVAPERKLDPGELFDWASLARAGIGLFPEPATPVLPDGMVAASLLAQIGYPRQSAMAPDRLALAAFQRRFRPARVDGRLDATTMGLLRAVVGLLRPAL